MNENVDVSFKQVRMLYEWFCIASWTAVTLKNLTCRMQDHGSPQEARHWSFHSNKPWV